MLKKKILIPSITVLIIIIFLIAGMIFPLKEEEENLSPTESQQIGIWNGIAYDSLSLITKDNKNYIKLKTINDLPKQIKEQQVILTIKETNKKIFFKDVITIPSFEPKEEKEFEIECMKNILPERYTFEIEIYSPTKSG